MQLFLAQKQMLAQNQTPNLILIAAAVIPAVILMRRIYNADQLERSPGRCWACWR